ncbi:mannose-1-phosphate guanylyltransferase/mannose-6-phosphate isomerase [Cupriavidus sp. P-10]|nr:mannose-1-phosphate guanylyltransferase/mannose-6-phosphate isomerase [Cupriavidus sp. P-10]
MQKAFLRATDLPGVSDVWTVTNRELYFKTVDEYHELGRDDVSTGFILEPVSRNTAAAIAAAALQISKQYGEETLVLILAADHLIDDQKEFGSAVSLASELALQGKLVTFGIQPDAPETGYGYLEVEGNNVVRFVEKPSLEKATEFVDSGRFLWNSGMFCFAAGAMLKEMSVHCPSILSATRQCIEKSRSWVEDGKGVRLELDKATFEDVPDASVDYAVMEKAAAISVVPCDIGWSDIGSWTALGEMSPADPDGNRLEGSVELHDTRNCTIHSNHRLVGAVGLENLIIIDSPDAVLVADKGAAQDVKRIYAKLESRGHEAHKFHRTMHRPWGTYTVLEEGTGFKIKRIEVKPGGRLSLQMHHHRSEHWIVVSGMAKVVNGEREFFVSTNESTYIPAGHKHRLENPGLIKLVMIEVQSGPYLEEDDIVRFQDSYGRA